MDYGKLLDDSFAYTKEGLAGNPRTWIMLLVLSLVPGVVFTGSIILAAFSLEAEPDTLYFASFFCMGIILTLLLSSFSTGFMVKILRGDNPLPSVAGFPALFADGIRCILIGIVYMVPAIIIFLITVVPALPAFFMLVLGNEDPETIRLLQDLIRGVLLTMIAGFIAGLFAIIGIVRFSRTGTVGEAFNMSAIRATIHAITWKAYLAALLLLLAIHMAVGIGLSLILIAGPILQFILGPFIAVFSMRYICLLCNSAGTG